jgi:hypothetical protein
LEDPILSEHFEDYVRFVLANLRSEKIAAEVVLPAS